MSHDRSERKGTQVVHVRDGSDQAFDELFKVVINPPDEQKNTPTLPFRMRNLPASFFKQPDAKNEGEVPGYPTQANGGMSIAHSRAHSSPATLQQTLSAAPPLPPQHIRQHSYDLVADEPLPPGWDIAKTSHGQRYFLNHLSQTTTWQDPRKSVSTTNLNKQQQQQQGGGPPGSQSPGSPSQSQQALDNTPLPQGWERAYTAEGEVYYINHINRTTSWFHPNIPPHLQRPGMRLQQQMVGGQPARPPQLGQRPLTPEEQQRQMKLQHLQREKERLQQRQEEIARQELLIRNLGPNADPNAAAAAAAAAAAQQQTQSQSHKIGQSNEMTSIADPFLGQTATSDLHSRQESGDSGLGGMGTNYSLPKTEDFLGVDEMDTQDGGHKLPCQGDFGMDMTPMGNGEGDAANMDSDDLVPSIQDDISNQLLRDVENVLNSNKDNLLTWL